MTARPYELSEAVQPVAHGYIRDIQMTPGPHPRKYPFHVPAVTYLAQNGSLPLAEGVTFLVGENGSGKSTILEAIAVAAGMNPEGGSQNYRFATRSSESPLSDHLILRWGIDKPRSRFFLRAESYYNVATETERLGPDQVAAMGGVSAHHRSHGESFLDLMVHRFHRNGLYLLDEPEAALSPQGCFAAMSRLSDLVDHGCQFVIATHSPLLLAMPGASIYEIADDGAISLVSYDDALPVRLTRDFLADPDRFLRHLL
ncbi:AAA family ATPase [Nocardia rhizosphaerae]|uniref:AAA family ATPase n=1 Tax=Nocardia rhizosphaerae TaxID=1691571 RepID=A0ABV8LB55_9NOCA